ncbi:hypothetical protein H0N99_00730 [Candidatus Micrarchaeota archaeon]|nr:hypothetical protein [Candidatus Micrarchaeota archaeon]
MLKNRTGQVGIEYMAILVLFLIILIPVMYIGMMDIQIEGQTSQARIAVDSIADTADRVYAQGPGTTTTVEVYLPAGINYASFSNREVNINLYLPTGSSTDVYALSRGNLTGTMPTLPGRHVLVVTMNSTGNVTIREATS